MGKIANKCTEPQKWEKKKFRGEIMGKKWGKGGKGENKMGKKEENGGKREKRGKKGKKGGKRVEKGKMYKTEKGEKRGKKGEIQKKRTSKSGGKKSKRGKNPTVPLNQSELVILPRVVPMYLSTNEIPSL